MAVSRTFPGFVIYLNFKDSAFLTVKRGATFSIRYKKGILFLMEDIRIYQSWSVEWSICYSFHKWRSTELTSQVRALVWSQSPPPLKFEVSGITRLLRNINAKNACGPDNISLAGFWKKLRLSLPHFSSIVLLYQYKTGQVPSDWVTANVSPVFKKRNRKKPCNYRTISLTSVSCKIVEHIIYRHIMNHLDSNSIPVHYQHGFRQRHSYEMQLITIIESVAGNLDLGQ